MGRDSLRLFDRPAIFQVRRYSSGAERVTANVRWLNSSAQGTALYHA